MLQMVVESGAAGTQQATLPGPVVRIGRAEDNELAVRDGRISSHHGRLLVRPEGGSFEDLGSRNGSLVERRDGTRITARAHEPLAVAAGDCLLLGDLISPVVVRLVALALGTADEDCGATIIARRAIASGTEALRQIDAPSLRALFELLHDLSGRSEPSEVMARLAGAVFDRFAGLRAVRVLLRDAQGAWRPEFLRTSEGSTPPSPDELPSPALLRQAESRGEVLVYVPGGETPAAHAATALIPLTTGGESLGVVQVERLSGTFSPDDAAWLSILGLHLAASLARAQRFVSLQRAEAELRQESVGLRAAAALPSPIVGRSAALRTTLNQLARVATTSTTVLLLGETGTGKELAARYLHLNSPRAERAFWAVNCAALPPQLLESELFGHVRGSFTGALRDHAGLFEAGRGGTVFLDEIGEVAPEVQVKLLRVIQEREVRPVGSNRSIPVDVRLVAATNRDLLVEVEAGRFRSDLYYRLSVFPVELPPLRLRTGDIELLAEHFREVFCARHGKWVPGFSREALERLRAHSWPGNVRELEHAVERALILGTEGEALTVEHLETRLVGRGPGERAVADSAGGRGAGEGEELPRGPLREVMDDLEERVIRRCLDEHRGNRTVAAVALGISRQALQAKLARWRELGR